MKTKISELMEKLNLVQDMTGDSTLKVEGTNFAFATPKDELARYIIAEIPNLFRTAKMCANMAGLDEETQKAIQEDGRAYLNQFETMAEIYLNESELRNL